MSTPVSQPSFEELYKALQELPDDQRGEILAGELVVSPRPVNRHVVTGGQIYSEMLNRFFFGGGDDRPGGWIILHEPELHLSVNGQTNVVAPDVAGWRNETMAEVPDASYLTIVSDWVCEVLSPPTAHRDRKVKARMYHDAGVRWLWLVDPAARSVSAFRREGAFWAWLGEWDEADIARIEPFEAVELQLSRWWAGMAKRKP